LEATVLGFVIGVTKFDFTKMTEGKVHEEYEVNDVDAKVSPGHVSGDPVHDVAENGTKLGTAKNESKGNKGEETNGWNKNGFIDITVV